MLIDTHAHLYWDSYKEDFDEVIQRCQEAGVETVINVGVDIEKSRIASEMESDQVKFYSTMGIHPHEATNYSDKTQATSGKLLEDIQELGKLYQANPQKVIGIGECGLDFLFDNNPDHNPSSLSKEELKDLQRKLFLSQIDLAKKLNLPLIVHVRDDRSKNPENTECWDEVLEMTKDHYGIYHCYSGLLQTTNYLLQTTNFLVSFAGNITYPKNDYLREAAKIIPLDRICLETDCPFLAPQSIRGQRNEPSKVLEIAELIAQIKGVSLEQVANQTTDNLEKLFKNVKISS